MKGSETVRNVGRSGKFWNSQERSGTEKQKSESTYESIREIENVKVDGPFIPSVSVNEKSMNYMDVLLRRYPPTKSP